MYTELYQEIIMDHYKNPRNKTDLADREDVKAHENPLCGDSIKLDIQFDSRSGIINRVFFDGNGCAIFTASASMMTEILSGMDFKKALKTIQLFINWLKTGGELPDIPGRDELLAFSELSRYPVRIKCALLSWHALLEKLSTV